MLRLRPPLPEACGSRCAWLQHSCGLTCSFGVASSALLVRFVAATDGDGVAWMLPDASGRLPGRGAYTLASPRAVHLAVANSALAALLPPFALPFLARAWPAWQTRSRGR